MYRVLIITSLVLMMVGCAPKIVKPEERIVYKAVAVPVELTEKVKATPPPHPVTYSQLSNDKKEETLINLIQEHTKTIGVCNSRLGSIESWSKEQVTIYEKKQ